MIEDVAVFIMVMFVGSYAALWILESIGEGYDE